MNFDELYEQYKDMVFNLALNYVQHYEDAQEVTQDVFVAVHRSLDSFLHKSNISTWVYRITINKSIDFLKAKKRKKRFGFIYSILGNEREDAISHYNHPGVQLEQKEAIKRIFSCINDLPDNQKTALLLSKTEQKSQPEIAEIMGISAKAVESLIQRAKTNLSKKLNRNEG